MKKKLLIIIPICLCAAILIAAVAPSVAREYGMSESERAVRDKTSVTMMNQEISVSQIPKQEAAEFFGETEATLHQGKNYYYFKDAKGGIYTYNTENQLKSYFSTQNTFPQGKSILISKENALQEITPVLEEVVPNFDEFELLEKEVGDTIGVIVFEREIAEGVVDQVSISFWTTGDIQSIVCNYSGFLSPDEITQEQRADLDRQAEDYIPNVINRNKTFPGMEVEVISFSCMLSRQNGHIKGIYTYILELTYPPNPGEVVDENYIPAIAHEADMQEFFVEE